MLSKKNIIYKKMRKNLCNKCNVNKKFLFAFITYVFSFILLYFDALIKNVSSYYLHIFGENDEMTGSGQWRRSKKIAECHVYVM